MNFKGAKGVNFRGEARFSATTVTSKTVRFTDLVSQTENV